jgi:hypothetical protein
VRPCVLQSCDAYWLPTPFFCFPLHFSSRASPCAITFQTQSNSKRSFVLTLYLGASLAAHGSGRTNLASLMITAAYMPLRLQGDSLRNSISDFNCVYILNTLFPPLLMNLFLYVQRNEHLPYHNDAIQSSLQLPRPFTC